MWCYCALHNFVDIWNDNTIPDELRFKQPNQGPIDSFFDVYYMPIAKHDEDRRPKLGPRLVQGIFVGYKLCTGGIWGDEYLVIDFEAFQETRVGLHIADQATKEIYFSGIAHGDK